MLEIGPLAAVSHILYVSILTAHFICVVCDEEEGGGLLFGCTSMQVIHLLCCRPFSVT